MGMNGIVLGGKNTGPTAQIIQSNYANTSNYVINLPLNVITSDFYSSVSINNSLQANTLSVGTINVVSTIAKYNHVLTVGRGIPSEVAAFDSAIQSAAIPETVLYSVLSDGEGLYRVSWVATCASAASVSSILGGETGFQIKYTDADDHTIKTSTLVFNSTANSVGTSISGTLLAYCKGSSNLLYMMDYMSNGASMMQYYLHVRLEAL